MASISDKKQDAKGEFLMELIESRNRWLNKMIHNDPDNEKYFEYASAYEKLIYAFTIPEDKNKK